GYEGAHRQEVELDQSAARSMRCWVVPPTNLDSRMPEDLLNSEQFDVEDGCKGVTDSVYFTDLLVNDYEDSQIPSPPSDPSSQHALTAAKTSYGRSKNFRVEEDILLVSAWLNVGMDPILGVDQSQGIYWRRIHEYFHGNKKFE
ncbi:hypothetical protein PVAP13_3NG234578, partial [Panicum virgatum]